jgi:hypothetical protein
VSSRRLVGGYVYRDELEGIRDRSQNVVNRLVAFSKKTEKPETLREIVEMVALVGANATAATDLLGYKDARDEERQ